MKQMNIWILNQYASTPDQQMTSSYDLANELARRGNKVTMFASGFSHYKSRELRLHDKEKWKIEHYEYIRFIWLKTTPYKGNDWRRVINMLSYAWRSFQVGKNLKEKPDVIIGTCPHPFAVLSAYLLSILRRSRFFFEIRDLWPQTLVDMGTISEKNPVTWMLRLLERFLYQKAEKIITVLPYAYEYVTKTGVSKNKIVWIPNGIILSRYKDLMQYSGGISKPFTLMYLGGHAKYNCLGVVLETAHILQNNGCDSLKFVLVGDGPEKLGLIQQSKDMGLHNVEFRKAVPRSEISKVMNEADAFIFVIKDMHLLKYGVSPNKLCDYLISGRPIIFAAKSRNNPVNEANAGITVPPENPESLAQAIMELIATEPHERIRMGKNGLEYVKKYYDIRVLADRLEALL